MSSPTIPAGNPPAQFEFATAARILFGRGKWREIGPIARSWGTRALLVTGRTRERAAPLIDLLASHGIACVHFPVAGEPTVHDVQEGSRLAHQEQCQLAVGFGGGSALDAAKAISALLTNPGDVFDYLEVVGRAQPLTQPAAPCIAIPTTAGTGTEVTRNAVLASPEHRFKVSLRSPFLLPRLAVVDPDLSAELPPHLTAATGLDALTQLIEPYVSPRANALTEGFCLEGLRRAARSLRRACSNGRDAQAREDMALASLLSGLALANAALGAVHGFAAPLGGGFSAPHGALCAAILPQAMAVNLRALRERQPNGEALSRYENAARILTGQATATAEQGVEWVRGLCRDLRVPPLRQYGVRGQDLDELIGKAAKASSMKGNPITLAPDELREILEQSV